MIRKQSGRRQRSSVWQEGERQDRTCNYEGVSDVYQSPPFSYFHRCLETPVTTPVSHVLRISLKCGSSKSDHCAAETELGPLLLAGGCFSPAVYCRSSETGFSVKSSKCCSESLTSHLQLRKTAGFSFPPLQSRLCKPLFTLAPQRGHHNHAQDSSHHIALPLPQKHNQVLSGKIQQLIQD